VSAGSTFQISLKPGDIAVAVNGLDISDAVQSVHVYTEQLTVPQVVLTLAAESVVIEGEGGVTLRGSQSLTEFLDAIDPKELENAAMSRSPYGGNLTSAMLQVLREQAENGHPA
jgi:hypothetical protein